MAVSRRLRFEILRRDNHACRYCGACAPDAKLTVDHVVPVALGGGDAPDNLVTACKDCNAGKSSASPDASHVADVARDALRWADALRFAAMERSSQRENIAFLCDEVSDEWSSWTVGGGAVPKPDTWRQSIAQFYEAGIADGEALREFVRVSMSKSKVPSWEKWAYFCGCCWRYVDDLQKRARELVELQTHPAPTTPPEPHRTSSIAAAGGALLAAFTDWDYDDALIYCCNNNPHPEDITDGSPHMAFIDDYADTFDRARHTVRMLGP